MSEELINTLADLQEKAALEIVDKKLGAGEDPLDILNNARRALEIVGKAAELAAGGEAL